MRSNVFGFLIFLVSDGKLLGFTPKFRVSPDLPTNLFLSESIFFLKEYLLQKSGKPTEPAKKAL